MTKAIIFASAAFLAFLSASGASAQQAPCNPAIDYCLPVPPEEPTDGSK